MKAFRSGWDSCRPRQRFLVSAGEESIDSEEDSVGDGESSFGDAEALSVARESANEFTGSGIVPVLQDQDTRNDVHGTTNGREVQI